MLLFESSQEAFNDGYDETKVNICKDQAHDVTSANELPSYPEETCLQPICLGQEVLGTDWKIFCLAPGESQIPKSVFREIGINAMAFPHLHPGGDFGFCYGQTT